MLRTPFPDQSRPRPVGKPTWKPDTLCCPNCGSNMAFVTCPVEPPPMLRAPAGKAVASYYGCPACPYASAAVITAAS